MNMLVFFLGKCVRIAAKTMVVNEKARRHQLCLISTAAKCCELKRYTDRLRSRTSKANFVT